MKTWRGRVRKMYRTLDELKAYDEVYSIVRRCGYKSAETLWKANPMIGGRVNPEDFGLVLKREER